MQYRRGSKVCSSPSPAPSARHEASAPGPPKPSGSLHTSGARFFCHLGRGFLGSSGVSSASVRCLRSNANLAGSVPRLTTAINHSSPAGRGVTSSRRCSGLSLGAGSPVLSTSALTSAGSGGGGGSGSFGSLLRAVLGALSAAPSAAPATPSASLVVAWSSPFSPTL